MKIKNVSYLLLLLSYSIQCTKWSESKKSLFTEQQKAVLNKEYHNFHTRLEQQSLTDAYRQLIQKFSHHPYRSNLLQFTPEELAALNRDYHALHERIQKEELKEKITTHSYKGFL